MTKIILPHNWRIIAGLNENDSTYNLQKIYDQFDDELKNVIEEIHKMAIHYFPKYKKNGNKMDDIVPYFTESTINGKFDLKEFEVDDLISRFELNYSRKNITEFEHFVLDIIDKL